jgi:hypothetical protein
VVISKQEGFPFLKDVDDGTLQQWSAFMETPFYVFIVKHFTNEINAIGSATLTKKEYVEKPAALAYAQGKAYGMRRVFSEFFNDIRTEHKRRLDRAANAGSDQHR